MLNSELPIIIYISEDLDYLNIFLASTIYHIKAQRNFPRRMEQDKPEFH